MVNPKNMQKAGQIKYNKQQGQIILCKSMFFECEYNVHFEMELGKRSINLNIITIVYIKQKRLYVPFKLIFICI